MLGSAGQEQPSKKRKVGRVLYFISFSLPMTFFNKLIDKAKSAHQQSHCSNSESNAIHSCSTTVQEPSTPAPTPTKELSNTLAHTNIVNHSSDIIQHHHQQQQQQQQHSVNDSSSNGLTTPPAHPDMNQSSSCDEDTRMSVDNAGELVDDDNVRRQWIDEILIRSIERASKEGTRLLFRR